MLCVTLSACGGGTNSSTDVSRTSSAYQAWLDEGHIGSEQDFLDSIVTEGNEHYVSVRQMAQTNGGYTITMKSWPKYGNFYEIIGIETSSLDTPYTGNDYIDLTKTIYNEKELNLANYGVSLSESTKEYEFGKVGVTYGISAWIHNREGIGKNVYTPVNGTVFKGGTLAYVGAAYSDNTIKPEFIKGDATYVYSTTNPQLTLDFANYYKFVFDKTNTTISGTNGTGNNRFDLNTGTISSSYLFTQPIKDSYYTQLGFVKKNGTEEMVGSYKFYTYYDSIAPNGYVGVTGAFGGEKQQAY